MKCPKCVHDLKRTSLRSIQVDECLSCHGIWFDKDELRKAKDSTDKDLMWLDFEPFQLNSAREKTEHKCPRCSAILESVRYADSKVKIDVCPSCKGVWLDDDEFRRIVNYLESIIVKQDSSKYAKDAFEELKELVTGPEDKASEIKDFLAVVNLLGLRLQAENPKVTDFAMRFSQIWPIH